MRSQRRRDMRRTDLSAIVFVAVTSGCLAVQPAPAQKVDEISLRLAWIPGFAGDQPPFFLGAAKGFYREVGIDLKIIEGKGAAPNATLLAQKSEQFSVIDA